MENMDRLLNEVRRVVISGAFEDGAGTVLTDSKLFAGVLYGLTATTEGVEATIREHAEGLLVSVGGVEGLPDFTALIHKAAAITAAAELRGV